MNKEENMEREMDDSFLDKKFKENSFLVPDNYFNNLEEQILAIAKLSSTETAENFKVPKGYFEDMNAKILSQINVNKASQESGFNVPESYFEELSANILEKTKVGKQVKMVRFSFIKYAAAAVVLIATTFGSYMYNQNNQTVTEKLSNIPDQEIADYLNYYTDAGDVTLIIESTDDFSSIEEKIDRQISN